jgi:hypothetical protein
MDQISYALTVIGIVALTALGVAISVSVRWSDNSGSADGKTKPVPRRR